MNMKDYSNCVIITANPDLLKPALREIKQISPDAAVVEDMGNGIYIVRVNEIPVTFLELFSRRNPIFVKHIMPICQYAALANERKLAIDTVVRTCLDLVDLKAGDEFSVQSRLIDTGTAYTAKDVEVAIGTRLENLGAIPRFSDTDVSVNANLRVISVLIRNTDCFVGYSCAGLNLNEHCDEFRVFSRKPRVICRAEYKLLEAIRKFHLVPRGQFAIDLGAAPGGWTYVLASKGFQVVSIDPGLLAEKVMRLAGVTHKRIRAEAFVPDREYDLLTNDMNLDPKHLYPERLI